MEGNSFEDELFGDELDSFAIPTNSELRALQIAKENENIERQKLHNFIKAQHNYLLTLENKLISNRYKSFELLRVQEECLRFHSQQAETEIQESEHLASLLLNQTLQSNQFESNPKLSTPKTIQHKLLSIVFPDHAPVSLSLEDATLQLIGNYLKSYTSLKKSNNNNIILFPWGIYDDSVKSTCITWLQHRKLLECRSYLIGYIECIARIPFEEQSNQGKLFTTKVGSILSRHPFSKTFTVFIVAIKILFKYIQSRRIQITPVKEMIMNFIGLFTEAWKLSWSPEKEIHSDLSELLTEVIQHSIFLSLPDAPSIFYPAYATNGMISSLEGNRAVTATYTDVASVRQVPHTQSSALPPYKDHRPQEQMGDMSAEITTVAVAVPALLDEEPVPFAVPVMQTPASRPSYASYDMNQYPNGFNPNNIRSIPMLYDICCVPMKFRYVNSPNQSAVCPYVEAFSHIDVLRNVKSPVEIIQVLSGVVEAVVSIAQRIEHERQAPRLIISSPTKADSVNGDELLTLVSFIFAMYFNAYRVYLQQQQLRQRGEVMFTISHLCNVLGEEQKVNSSESVPPLTRQEIMVLMQFADEFLPDHLRPRQEAYILTVCMSALTALPADI